MTIYSEEVMRKDYERSRYTPDDPALFLFSGGIAID